MARVRDTLEGGGLPARLSPPTGAAQPSLRRMLKGDLKGKAAGMGIAVGPEWSKNDIIEAIEAKDAAD